MYAVVTDVTPNRATLVRVTESLDNAIRIADEHTDLAEVLELTVDSDEPEPGARVYHNRDGLCWA